MAIGLNQFLSEFRDCIQKYLVSAKGCNLRFSFLSDDKVHCLIWIDESKSNGMLDQMNTLAKTKLL